MVLDGYPPHHNPPTPLPQHTYTGTPTVTTWVDSMAMSEDADPERVRHWYIGQ